jgi:excisionase family DNA binding protein
MEGQVMGFVTGGSMKLLLRIDEVRVMLGCSRDHVYDLLRDGRLRAHNPNGRPGTRGTRIIAASVTEYVTNGTIHADEWTK